MFCSLFVIIHTRLCGCIWVHILLTPWRLRQRTRDRTRRMFKPSNCSPLTHHLIHEAHLEAKGRALPERLPSLLNVVRLYSNTQITVLSRYGQCVNVNDIKKGGYKTQKETHTSSSSLNSSLVPFSSYLISQTSNVTSPGRLRGTQHRPSLQKEDDEREKRRYRSLLTR